MRIKFTGVGPFGRGVGYHGHRWSPGEVRDVPDESAEIALRKWPSDFVREDEEIKETLPAPKPTRKKRGRRTGPKSFTRYMTKQDDDGSAE